MQITKDLRYKMAFLATVYHLPGMDAQLVANKAEYTIKNEIKIMLSANDIYFYALHRSSPCMGDDNSTKVRINFEWEFFIFQSVNRIIIERNLTYFLRSNFPGSAGINNIQISEDADILGNNPSFIPSMDRVPNECPLASSAVSHVLRPDYFHMAKVSDVLICRQIELDEDEYNITDNKSLYLRRRDVITRFSNYDITPNGRVRVCLELLQELDYFVQVGMDASKNDVEKYLWIVSLICTVVSVVCLSISLLIYCAFPVLRTIPGKLIMLLITSLLFTLVFQQLTFLVVGSHSGCVAIGIVLHIGSLTVFTCMNTCNFHMYKVFKSTKPRKQSTRVFFDKAMVQYSVYIFCVPFLITTLNIIVHVILSSGSSIGYGGSKCFILNTVAIVVAFIIPVLLTCISNIFFFISTAITIHRTPNPAAATKSREEMGIFVRLTSITGISWLLQIIDSFFPLSAFSFVASAVNLLQGLFIFLSFAVNRRNFNLLREKYIIDNDASRTSMLFQSSCRSTNSSAKTESSRM